MITISNKTKKILVIEATARTGEDDYDTTKAELKPGEHADFGDVFDFIEIKEIKDAS